MNADESPAYFSTIHPVTRRVADRSVLEGDRVTIAYKTPVRLPMIHPEEGHVALTVASITGTVRREQTQLALHDAECVICAPTDHSVRDTCAVTHTILRLFPEDEIRIGAS